MRNLRPIERAIFALLVGTAVVSFWRGAGGLMNLYILPSNPLRSYGVSIFAGLFILAITHYWTKELS